VGAHLCEWQLIAFACASRAQVMSCTDATTLDLWFDRAITVNTAAEVFAD
jgi:hypothetical protein